MSTLDATRLAEGLHEQTGGLADAVDGRDPSGPVPTCPEWRLWNLVGHVGQAHRWAAELVREREAPPVPDPLKADPGPPADWAAWLRDGADELAGAVEKTGPDTAVTTFLGLLPASFWLRRMLHDTAVHHADAAIAAGVPFTIAPDLAADALSEWFGLIASPGAEAINPRLAVLRGRGETLAVRPAGGAAPGWLITRTPEGPRWEREGDGRDADAGATVTVTAPLRELLLVVYRRSSPEEAGAEVSGDRSVLDHWLANTAF
ncbi:maleylpyruvate isomerase family mycothiol-dependent enzyme [Actinomadura rubrisoli]|uniref:Maleylpyruvate isomerase family mycothiol-dependent enzyme n=1 Tax=Actinomadura rubrisoli TaxID=2530368 RepID=A0A4V2YWS4_9ACTN|nr:maleylpyruvate isomerase family mycothiol-dependent enzyme [Actinomadura rubrisoli]TDD86567.1 maleylpyruvate isomerase family mycothiol-dependent enzyme [Actinomadura rubrisoli]